MNLKTAKVLGLTVRDLLALADEAMPFASIIVERTMLKIATAHDVLRGSIGPSRYLPALAATDEARG